MYTVVVCSNCRYVWIVQDRPKTSRCGKCRKRRKFKKLKKYHNTDDLEEAKLARAFYQSRVNNQAERFDRALERGILKEDLEAFISDSEYLDQQGIDSEQVDDIVSNLLQSPEDPRSEVEIIKDALHTKDDPTISEFYTYVEERGISREKAILKLEKLLLSDRLEAPDSISLRDVNEEVDELLGDSSEQSTADTTPAEGLEKTAGPDSQLQILRNAAEEHGSDTMDEILDYAVERGVEREKAAIYFEKLVRRGGVTVDLDLQDIETAAATEIETEKDYTEVDARSHDDSSDSESESNLSQKNTIIKAIEEQNTPNKEDVVDFAQNHGVDREKAEKILEKMIATGNVLESTDNSLRKL